MINNINYLIPYISTTPALALGGVALGFSVKAYWDGNLKDKKWVPLLACAGLALAFSAVKISLFVSALALFALIFTPKKQHFKGEELTLYNQAQQFQENPRPYIENVVEKENLPLYVADLILASDPKAISQVNAVLSKIVTELNQAALNRLNDPLISEEVRLELLASPLIKSLSYITPAQMDNIVAEARRLTEQKRGSEVADYLKQKGVFIPDGDKIVIQQTGGILTEDQLKRHMINKALLHNEMNKLHPARKQGTLLEEHCLHWLGYSNMLDFENRRKRYLALKSLLENAINSSELLNLSPADITHKIEEMRVNKEFKLAGIGEGHIPLIKTFITEMEKLTAQLKGELSMDPPSGIKNAVSLRFIAKNREKLAEYYCENQIREAVKSNKLNLKSLLDKPDEFTRAQETIKSECLSAKQKIVQEISESEEKTLLFYKKWDRFIKVAAIQGLEDRDECLGTGVCFGKCLRMGSQEQKNPAITDLKADTILPLDRKLQSMYTVKVLLTNDMQWVTPEVLKVIGFQSVHSLDEAKGSIKEVQKKLTDRIERLLAKPDDLKKSHGVLYYFFNFWDKYEEGGHATYLRIDPEREIVRFQEPNIGLVEIPLEFGPFQDRVYLLLDCIHDTLEQYYPFDGYLTNLFQIC